MAVSVQWSTQAGEALELLGRRHGRQEHSDNITDRILAGIRGAQVVVADFTLQQRASLTKNVPRFSLVSASWRGLSTVEESMAGVAAKLAEPVTLQFRPSDES